MPQEDQRALLHTTLIGPIMEYASVVWDPFTEENIRKLEMVHRRAGRMSTLTIDLQAASQICCSNSRKAEPKQRLSWYAGPDKSIARPPGTSPKSRRASLFRLYDARSGKCQKIARTVKSASIYGKKV